MAYVVKVTYSRDESNRDGVGSILTDAVSYLERKKKFQGGVSGVLWP